MTATDERLLWRPGVRLCAKAIGQRDVRVGGDRFDKGPVRGTVDRVCNLPAGHGGRCTDHAR